MPSANLLCEFEHVTPSPGGAEVRQDGAGDESTVEDLEHWPTPRLGTQEPQTCVERAQREPCPPRQRPQQVCAPHAAVTACALASSSPLPSVNLRQSPSIARALRHPPGASPRPVGSNRAHTSAVHFGVVVVTSLAHATRLDVGGRLLR